MSNESVYNIARKPCRRITECSSLFRPTWIARCVRNRSRWAHQRPDWLTGWLVGCMAGWLVACFYSHPDDGNVRVRALIPLYHYHCHNKTVVYMWNWSNISICCLWVWLRSLGSSRDFVIGATSGGAEVWINKANIQRMRTMGALLQTCLRSPRNEEAKGGGRVGGGGHQNNWTNRARKYESPLTTFDARIRLCLTIQYSLKIICHFRDLLRSAWLFFITLCGQTQLWRVRRFSLQRKPPPPPSMYLCRSIQIFLNTLQK